MTTKPQNPATSSRARIWLLASSVAIALILGELAVRSFDSPSPVPRRTEPAGFSPMLETPKGLYVYRPGVRFAHVYDPEFDKQEYFGPGGRIEYRINGLGHRGRETPLEKGPDVRRVLCLGDSFTFGEGVHEADSWPEQLGRLLGAGSEVLNAGVQGYDLDHEALYLLLYGRHFKPDIVVIGFFVNDAMPFAETVAHHEAVTESAPRRSGLARASALWNLWERWRRGSRQQLAYVADLEHSFTTQKWKGSRERLKKLRELADHDGFEIVGLIFPLLYELGENYPLEQVHEDVRGAFREAGIPSVDLLDVYRGLEARDLWVHPVDPHPNKRAHELAARSVAKWLETQTLP